jgi:TRAP-type mannitol/chloroaromatic compound transport system permease small subunit
MRLAIERFVDATGRATSWLALVIVVLMAANVLLRYLFRTGSVWSQELEWHLLAPLILFGMSYAMQKGEHVRVDIVYGRFSPRAKAAVDFLSAVLCAIISIAIVWLSVKYVEQSYVINEQSQDPGGLPYRWILKALIPVGFVVLLLQSLATAAASAARFRETT